MHVGQRHESGACSPVTVDLADGEHFSCSLSMVLLARVYEFGGDGAVEALLRRAGSTRTPGYLNDIGNWISYAEATALWRAGTEITHHPDFAHQVGVESARRLNGSPVATLLRSLGSPENVYRQIATTAAKYSAATTLEAVDCGPGHAEVVAHPNAGFPRDQDHCSWTRGLLATTTLLFGLPPATVEHDTCAAFGAAACHYHVSWPAAEARERSHSSEEVDKLRDQLDAMKERLHSMFQTASDLIASGDVDDILSRIADRAATEVRAPCHLLVVRMTPDGPLHLHHDGFAPEDIDDTVQALLSQHPSELPASWLAVPIRSSRREYGYLLAVNAGEVAFFLQERELLEVYARYAASALDSASALLEAESRYGQSSALLELARALSVAGTSSEVARRLADSVPVVVDCDQVAVYVWNGDELVREAATHNPDGPPLAEELATWKPHPGSTLERLLSDPRPDPVFIDGVSGDPGHVAALRQLGFEATIMVPLVAGDALLGVLAVAVRERPERLRPTPDLLDRLSGVGAQAGVALQNGRLVDLITYQALHDQLTGLANRVQFTTELRGAVGRATRTEELACLFYIDLDRFKPVNDEFGHETGDELLVAVAERLRQCTRATDVVARLGGDEFAVLVVAPGPEEIETVAERLAAGFEQPFQAGDLEIPLTVSIGRSVYPADAPDADGLLRRADEAMFVDKRARQYERGVAGRAA
jgi:diguanylate cyclase (GGDEF)-like protein